ncbi:hypothetical protein SUGI_0304320 [Cryptomeria japonica]|nr:hypothetical protein SUGI_0304320 [Cryptomeria japonica]
MPRCRHRYFHVVNNDYTHWEIYSMGNVQVTKHQDSTEGNWRSVGDLMLNGAFFTTLGAKASSMAARPSSIVGSITASSSVLTCRKGSSC